MAAKSRPPPSAAEAIALMQKAPSRGRGRRSPVMVWMQQNRDALATAFAQTAPAWSVLAAYLGERGVTDGDGKPPTARTAREAWARVKAIAQTAPSRTEANPAVVQLAPADAGDTGTGERPSPAGERFTVARLRNHTPSAPKAPAARPAPVKRDADAEIRRLLGDKPPRQGFQPPDPKE